MYTLNSWHRTRGAVLIAIAEDMTARTNMSRDGFAECSNIELNLRASERCRAKDYPDLKVLKGTAASYVSYAWVCGNRGKRVERRFGGDAEIPAWIEESWVQTLKQPWREHVLLELPDRYGLLLVRPVVAEGMDVTKVLGALVRHLGDVADVDTRVFDDTALDARDDQLLPDLINAPGPTITRCTTPSRIAKSALVSEK